MSVNSVLCFNSITSPEPNGAIRLYSFYLAFTIALD